MNVPPEQANTAKLKEKYFEWLFLLKERKNTNF